MNCVAVVAFSKAKDIARVQPLPAIWPFLGTILLCLGQPYSLLSWSFFNHDAMVRRFRRPPFRGRLPAVLPARIRSPTEPTLEPTLAPVNLPEWVCSLVTNVRFHSAAAGMGGANISLTMRTTSANALARRLQPEAAMELTSVAATSACTLSQHC